jgi:hypothetical protein
MFLAGFLFGMATTIGLLAWYEFKYKQWKDVR